MSTSLHAVVAAAIAEGVLPASAASSPSAEEHRPWPVVLLTALGAWLAAIPQLVVVGMLLGDLIKQSAGPYLVGVLVLAGAVVVLRSKNLPLFVEQLAVPALLVGGGSLGFGVFRDLPDQLAAALLAGLALGFAAALPRAWLRVLLGALAAGLLGLALQGTRGDFFDIDGADGAWFACHALLAVGLAMGWAQVRVEGAVQGAGALIESVSAGWWLVVLFGLAVLSGMSFLVGGAVFGSVGGLAGEVTRELANEMTRNGFVLWGVPITSALLAAVAALWAARSWPSLRQPAWAAVALVLIGLAFVLPTLGGAMLVLSAAATTQRWRLAGAAALAVAWIVGSFYYQLAWPLATKALILVGAGAVLGALAWWLLSRERADAAEADTAPSVSARRPALWIAAATVATLGVATFAIWQKQDLITHGRPVFVELAPVDPRSLMQGDYMRLAFRLPGGVAELPPPGMTGARPRMVALRDARGVATPLRTAAPGAPLAEGELLIELTPKNGGWVLVTDAWFFREGDAERWALAKYGEFRVTPDGRALLVGMADADLKPIPID